SRAKTLALRDRPCELASPARSRTAMPASPSASLAELRRGERSAARASVRVCLPEVGRDLGVGSPAEASRRFIVQTPIPPSAAALLARTYRRAIRRGRSSQLQ